MKKPFKVLSSTALAAVLASSALVPVAAFAAETNAVASVEYVVVNVDGTEYEILSQDYAALKSEDYFEGKTTKVRYVKSTTGTYFDAERYASVKSETGNAEEALNYLEAKPDEAKTVNAGKIEIGPNGPVVTEPSEVENFEVTDIAAINKTGVTVNFPKLETAVEGATVEVKNPAGDIVAVKAQDLAIDATEATFEFVTALEEVTPGEWEINGVTYKVLTAAEEALAEAVKAAEAAITELPEPITLDEEVVGAVEAARALVDEALALDKTAEIEGVDVLEAAEAKIAELQAEADTVEATEAVEAYESAPLKNADEVIAAETLAKEATEAVEGLEDGDVKTDLTERIIAQDEEVAAARVVAEQKAVDLINSSTVYNIVERLQAPILALEGVNPDYATKYQAARVANFTNTKEQIQNNVINHVQAQEDAAEEANQEAIAGLIENIDEAVTAYKNAKNEGEQNTATNNMADALLTLQTSHGLTTYTAGNNDAYMEAFIKANTVADFGQVQTIIQAVNGEVDLVAQVQEATGAVEALTDSEGALDADQAEIDAAQALVTALPDGETKSALQEAINKAQQLLDDAELTAQVEEATNAVEALTEGDALATQDEIDAAQDLVDALAETGYDVADLNAAIHVAQILLNTEEATDAVYDLFTEATAEGDVDSLVLEEGITQEDITDAKSLVTALPKEVDIRAELLVKVDKAQELYTAAEEEADAQALEAVTTTVNALFEDVEAAELALAELVDQAGVTAAKAEVEALADSAEKEALLAKVQAAQNLLDTAALNEATLAVEALTDDEGELVAEQAGINDAQALVTALPDGDAKTTLQAGIDAAQELLDVATLNAAIEGEGAQVIQDFIVSLGTTDAAAYYNLKSVQRAEFVLYLVNNIETPITSTNELKEAIAPQAEAYLAKIAAVNNATTSAEMVQALNAVSGDYAGLSSATKLDVADALVDNVTAENFAGYKTIAEIEEAITAAE